MKNPSSVVGRTMKISYKTVWEVEVKKLSVSHQENDGKPLVEDRVLEHVEHHEEAGPGRLEADHAAEVVGEARKKNGPSGDPGSTLGRLVSWLLSGGGEPEKQSNKYICNLSSNKEPGFLPISSAIFIGLVPGKCANFYRAGQYTNGAHRTIGR